MSQRSLADAIRVAADPDLGGLAQRFLRPRPLVLAVRMADCHPDRLHCAHGLCAACYCRARRRRL